MINLKNNSIFKSLGFYLIFLVCLVVFNVNCASFSLIEVTINGTAKLSDNPQTGHGDIEISTDFQHVYSDYYGNFKLYGYVMGEKEIKIFIKKEGYKDTFVNIKISKPEEGDKVEINCGEIFLEKI